MIVMQDYTRDHKDNNLQSHNTKTSPQPNKATNMTSSSSQEKFKYQAAAFLTGIAGVSVLGGFGMTLGMAKKKDPNMFNKGMMGTRELREAGGALALRALGWGSLYAVAGFSVFCFSIWKLSGAKDLHDFRMKAGSVLPNIPKNDPPQSRTEFEGLTDLLQYIITEDEKKKEARKTSHDSTT